MTVPGAPLPVATDLVRALFARPASDVQYDRGTTAIAAAVQSIPNAVLTAPDFICDDALDGVRRLGVPIRFYPVTPELAPDFAWLEKASWDGGHVLLLVHYFGATNRGTDDALAFCAARGVRLIEDAAHVLRARAGMGRGDFIVYSPRKVLAVPNGGVLQGRNVSRLSDGAPIRGTTRWLVRRLVQKTLRATGRSWHRGWTVEQFDCPAVPPAKAGGACDAFSRRLIAVADLDAIEARRRANFDRLASVDKPVIDDALYMFPMDVQHDIRGLHAGLLAAGVPAIRWPKLPQPVLQDRATYRVAHEVRDRLLLLPIHQSVEQRDLDLMVRVIRSHG